MYGNFTSLYRSLERGILAGIQMMLNTVSIIAGHFSAASLSDGKLPTFMVGGRVKTI